MSSITKKELLFFLPFSSVVPVISFMGFVNVVC